MSDLLKRESGRERRDPWRSMGRREFLGSALGAALAAGACTPGSAIATAEETRPHTYREQLETPIVARHQVIVVGGGPSGVIAAAAAARSGADTFLIERYPFLGGNGTAGLMTCYNGFRNQRPPEALQTVKGIPAEYIAELVRLGGAHYSTGLALRRISASAVIPRPGPVGTFMAPFFSRRGGSYQEPV